MQNFKFIKAEWSDPDTLHLLYKFAKIGVGDQL